MRAPVLAWPRVEPGVVLTAAAVATVTATSAALSLIGADARWLAALGRLIVMRQAIPHGVPFAAAPTSGWTNPIALAELLFHAFYSAFGDSGLMIAQLAAVAVAATVLARDARAAGASPRASVVALLWACLGAIGSLTVVRVQLFSLALFPILVALLRSEVRSPSRRIWAVVPLIALWSNLHGAVLIGLGVTLVYLAVVRFRQQRLAAVAVGTAATLALCVTPSGLRTFDYYHGVLGNQASARGQGLWAPLSLSSPLDVLLVVVALGLLVSLRRLRPPAWEMLVLALLAAATIHAARSGVWLMFFLVAPAARALRPRTGWDRVLPALGAVAVGGLALAVLRGPLPSGASRQMISRTIAAAHGTPVLAEDIAAEELALAGGRVWLSNPIDAFPKRDQLLYLDWLQGRSDNLRRELPLVHVVLVLRGSDAQRSMAHQPGYTLASSDRRTELYLAR